MRRRTFIALLASAAGWPLAVHAQQQHAIVGFLSGGSPEHPTVIRYLAAWRKALAEAGFVEGRNLTLEFRWSDRAGQSPSTAAELVERRVDLIMATNGGAARAAKAATVTIPIVFTGPGDPVGSGLVESISHPGGNVTGIAGSFEGVVEKRLQLFHELVPNARRIGYLENPASSSPTERGERIAAAGQAFGVEVVVLRAVTPDEIEPALDAGRRLGIEGLVVSDSFFGSQKLLLELVTRHALPAAHTVDFAAMGGLMSFGLDLDYIAYQAGTYVGRILRGAKPAELPIMQPTNFKLVINLKAAKALGLTVPQPLLVRADEVIE